MSGKRLDVILNTTELSALHPGATVCEGGIGIPRGCMDIGDTNINQTAELAGVAYRQPTLISGKHLAGLQAAAP
jgi:hypothetical protein